jgi:hypothetical protein
MPGIMALGKLFFEKKILRETRAYIPAPEADTGACALPNR